MSKKRKTRKEKELSKLRREIMAQQQPASESAPISYSVSNIKPKKEKERRLVFPKQGTGFITNHEYVLTDAKHTLIASGILIILYAILFVFKDYFFSLIIH